MIGDLLHHLILCPSLSDKRDLVFDNWDNISTSNLAAYQILCDMKTRDPDILLQFVLDCSAMPEIIAAAQVHGEEL